MTVALRSALVVDASSIARDVRRVTLRDAEGQPLPGWEPGAHVDVVVAPGISRQYSLCGDVADGSSWTVAVRLIADGSGGSRGMHALQAGDRVQVSAPRNRFPLDAADRYLFVAGGIGITPILPMIRHVRTTGAEWTAFYAGRDRESMPFLDELADDERVRLWADDVDGLPDIDRLLADVAPGTLVYCCGPSPMIEAVRAASRDKGLECRFEQFTPAETADEAGPAEGFEVVLSQSGRSIPVPAGTGILDALLEAGVNVDYSCHEGTCGTCETVVLEGVPDHRDPMWSEDGPEDSMLICVSRSRTPRLVLDL